MIDQFIKDEWQQFKSSKTVKAIVAIETGAILLFIQGVMAGTQPLTLDAIKGWLVVQAGLVLAMCWRHTQAGIEVKLDGVVPVDVVKNAEAAAQVALLKKLESKSPELASQVREHLVSANDLT